MFRLRVVQAEYGDCLILEYGEAEDRYILIDGGPAGIFEGHLRRELEAINGAGGKLDIVVLSHVHDDHVIGLLDLTSELRRQKGNGGDPLIQVDALWHNSFGETIGNGNDIEARFKETVANAAAMSLAMGGSSRHVLGISEGNTLQRDAALLGIPRNKGFDNGLVCVDDQPAPRQIGNLSLTVVGPTKQNIDALRKDWLAWLKKYGEDTPPQDPYMASMADISVPNLSSIMLLAEADSKTVLLTGDGRGDYLIKGLGEAGLLDDNGCIHVDVLKLPHHGSNRDVTKKFFKTVTADKYVISANGRDDNPDLSTLIWLVEAARDQSRQIEIYITNETPSTKKLLEEYNPDEYGYGLKAMSRNSNSFTIDLDG